MSILEWVQGLGWRLAVLVVIPLAAGVAAYFVVADEPPDYRAVATVNAPAPPTANPTPQVANQAVANLQSLVSSKAFADVISDDTGVPASKVRSSLVSSRVGAGTLVEISSTSLDGSEAVVVVTAAGHRSVELVLSDDLAAAQAAVDLALASFNKANDAVGAAVDSHGADPSVQLDLARGVFVQTQAARARAVAGGTTSTELRTLDNEIEDLESEIAALVPIADEFELLTRAREAAGEQVVATTSQVQAVEAVIAAADASVVEPTDASQVSNRVPIARKVATVVVLAGILALIVVLVLDLIWPRGDKRPLEPAPVVRSSGDV